MTSANPSPPAAATLPPRTFWQRRIRDPLVAQLTQGITPEKIALTLAVGTACALFPIFGATTLLCIAAAITLRLNQPIIHLLNQACWPVHIPAMYGFIRFGEYLCGAPAVSFNVRHMRDLLWNHPALFFRDFGATAFHAVIAWLVLAPPFVALAYLVALPVTRRIARLKARTDEASP